MHEWVLKLRRDPEAPSDDAREELPMKYATDNKPAQDLISKRLVRLQFLRSQMKGVISSSGNNIMRKWNRMSRSSRKFELDNAFPSAFSDRFFRAHVSQRTPEYRAYVERCVSQTAFCGVSDLVPWLDLELLAAEPDLLLALVHYRSQHEPSEWYTYDSQQLIHA
jgi:hypothetical protein